MSRPPSLTKTWHDDTYDAIDPRKRADLQNGQGKTVIISGGGSGIGRGFAHGFADAAFDNIVILGRRIELLKATKQEVEERNKKCIVKIFEADVTSLSAIEKVAQDVGSWDVLVSNAGYLPETVDLVDSNPEDWWKAFEVNVKGAFNLIHAFAATKKANAALIGVNAGSIQVPMFSAKWTAYNASKMAQLKLLQDVAVEIPDLHVVSMHPGVVESEMSSKATKGKSGTPKMDKVELPAHFAVWLCSSEAKFLRGKFVWCNWDVEELLQKKSTIENSALLTVNCLGWPYEP